MYFLISDHSTTSLTMALAKVMARESSARADLRGIASLGKILRSCASQCRLFAFLLLIRAQKFG
jgi:hypothetical protein